MSGGRGTQQRVMHGGSTPRSKPLPFYTPLFWTEKQPFHIHVMSTENGTPFTNLHDVTILHPFSKLCIREIAFALADESAVRCVHDILKGPFKDLSNDSFLTHFCTSTRASITQGLF